MTDQTNFEVIIIGGSYSGLSAAMSLGRSLRQILVIDSGKPCNIQTPQSHNFITQDGQAPLQILALAKEQVEPYETVTFYSGLAASGTKTATGFEIKTQTGDTFSARKLLFATGLKDNMSDISGFSECWGISVLHCPYCHGYEVKNERTGILANGESAFEFARMISNWTKDLTVYTNGKSTLTSEQTTVLSKRSIEIIETEIVSFEHQNGHIRNIIFRDRSKAVVKAIYARPAFEQHSDIPQALGCQLSENGLIQVDTLQKTTIAGVYACGDNSNFGRSVSLSVSSGSMAGAFLNKELIEEDF